MSAVGAEAFTKSRACPSSEEVSLSHSFRLPRDKAEKITLHITGCEFCAAERSFLSAYAQTTEEYQAPEMPPHLHKLAEALLIRRMRGFPNNIGQRNVSNENCF